MPVKVSFADLSHTGKTVDANFFPLGCGYIASYALEHLKGQIEVQIFKYPADFSAYLEQTIPRIACFSNYSWNLGLNYEYARPLKARHPHVITVFGGPNYPIAEEVREQEAFLREQEIGGFIYEQKVTFIPESNLVRIYAHDVTGRRRASERANK